MLDACQAYQVLAHEQTPVMLLFILWQSLHEPRFFLPQILQKLRDLGSDDDLRQLNKLQFFRELLPAASTIENA